MSVALRLSRGGSKKRPFYRIVAADVRAPRDGRFLERLGTYNPMVKKDNPERVIINTERVNIGFQLVPDQQKEFKNFLLMLIYSKSL